MQNNKKKFMDISYLLKHSFSDAEFEKMSKSSARAWCGPVDCVDVCVRVTCVAPSSQSTVSNKFESGMEREEAPAYSLCYNEIRWKFTELAIATSECLYLYLQ